MNSLSHRPRTPPRSARPSGLAPPLALSPELRAQVVGVLASLLLQALDAQRPPQPSDPERSNECQAHS